MIMKYTMVPLSSFMAVSALQATGHVPPPAPMIPAPVVAPAPLPHNFNAQVFLLLNPDVDQMTAHMTPLNREVFAENYYRRFGVHENRPYLINPQRYFQLNPDIGQLAVNMPPAQQQAFAQQHFINHGMAEGREFR
jgi:hypothetical protein